MKNKENQYIIIYLENCDDGYRVEKLTGSQIRMRLHSGELFKDCFTIIRGGEIIKSDSNSTFDFTRL